MSSTDNNVTSAPSSKPEPSPNSRYITTHDSDGKAVFAPTYEVPQADHGSFTVSRMYAVQGFPLSTEGNRDLENFVSDDKAIETSRVNMGSRIVIPNGLACNFVEWTPGSSTPMHKTESVDFVAVVDGEIELQLDSGEKRLMKNGVGSLPFLIYSFLQLKTQANIAGFIHSIGCLHYAANNTPLGQSVLRNNLPDGFRNSSG
ncbi:hypothetical protein AK830_g5193 [Neonectria ditissima]|uniref:Uncharacterized protein n=1 Tax=Neonectria ditissima TaxID=78410 RepID=A0A0P7BLN8_9HYPO|nr:hypothetical protein AK830_g5193 [Neonectria ditissima]